MKLKSFFAVAVLALFFVLPASAKDAQKIVPGQYVIEDGILYIRTTPLLRYDHPYAPRVSAACTHRYCV